MEALLSARAALLQALFEGPGYGVLLARRVSDRTSGHVRLGHGNIYTALRALEQEGLLRSWTVVPRGRRGARARLYYELTPRGIEVAEAQRRALTGLVNPAWPAPSDEAVALMRSRLEDCSELSAGVLTLRDRMREDALRRVDLVRIARQVARILGSDECILVGGLAVGAHGYVRATKDVDFVTRMPLPEAQRRLRERGIPTTIKRGDVLEGDFPCLKGTIGGVRIDVMPPLVPLQWERGIDLIVTRTERLRVVDLDGLLRLKLRAQGPKDLMDAAALMLRHPGSLAKGRELAVGYDVADKLETWLKDRRLRNEIEESAAGERLRKLADRLDRRPARGRGDRRR